MNEQSYYRDALVIVWSIVGAVLILLPRIRLLELSWLSTKEFKEKYPNKDWLTGIYTFFPIIWVPLSIAFTANYVEGRRGLVFFVFIVFIPLVGVGIFKGMVEMVLGVGSHITLVRMRDDGIPWFLSVGTRSSLTLLRALEYRFAIGDGRIRQVGALRMVIHVVFLAGLVFLLG